MLDEQVFKPLSVLKDNPGFAKLDWFTQFRLTTSLDRIGLKKLLGGLLLYNFIFS